MTAELLLVIVTFCGSPIGSRGYEAKWTPKDRNICVSSILDCVQNDKTPKETALPKVARCLVR
jgi:hypothetical protein